MIANQIAVMSPNDLTYLLDVIDQSYAMNSQPVQIKRIDKQATTANSDDLFDEALDKVWTRATIQAIVVNRPSPELQDRFATRHPVKLVIAVSQLALERAGWTISPLDVIEYEDAYGNIIDYYAFTALNDGMYIDTAGRRTPVSFTIGCTDEKVPTVDA